MPSDPFDEFLRQFQPKDDRQNAQELAQATWVMHTAFLEAGFTVDQAFELTKLGFASAVAKS